MHWTPPTTRCCRPRVDAALRSSQVDELQNYPRPFESNESDLATRSWGILGIFLPNSSDFHRNRPRLPGAVHYSYLKLLLHQLFSQPPKAPGRSGLHLYQAFAPPTLLTAAQGSRAQWITLIPSFCSTNSSHSHPRLPGAVHYIGIKTLQTREVASAAHICPIYPLAPNTAPPIASPSSTLPPSKAGTILGDCADSARDKDDALVHIVRFADFNFHPALGPLALEQICPACALEVALSIREEVVRSRAQGRRRGWSASAQVSREQRQRTRTHRGPKSVNSSCLGQRMVEEVSGVLGQRFDAPEERKDCSAAVDPRVYDVGVGTDDERVLEDSGWWRRCPVFLGSGSTLPKNERIAARRWLIRPRIRPESKLQDKCFERTAALDVENTMCRVNGIGSNAGAWDAADRGGTLSESLGTGLTLPKNELRLQGAEAGSPTSPPPPAGGSAGYPHGVLVCPPRNGGGVTPAAAVLAQTHAVLTPALADAIWHVARAPAVEKLVDEHPADFHLMDSAGYFFSTIRRNAAPTYVPSEEDVLRARAKSTAIIETRFWMGGLMNQSTARPLVGSVGRMHCGCVLPAMPTSSLFPKERLGEGAFRACPGAASGSVRAPVSWGGVVLEDGDVNDGGGEDADAVPPDASLRRANRMRGPLYLFESVINSLWFLRTSVILFLNKIDVFKRNIVSRPSSSPRATTSTSRALGAARAAATAPVTSAVGYSTPFSPPVRPARGRYLRD
ncbi:hypothetical protein B0H14DRAFT_2641474 [Mycena olivaceomarginata]|nr:hypothetical protein B0H14DRAFT_2641474 [Mycena olivaceomarginata]